MSMVPSSSSEFDFLDAKGKHQNFLNGAAFSQQYLDLATAWSSLPMYSDALVMRSLVASIEDNQVTLVVSGTGSGKTVIVPKVAAKVIAEKVTPFRVAITNPKSSTTRANAEYAAACMDVPIGAEVGYQFRGSPPNAMSSRSCIHYVTDGILLAHARRDPMLSNYDCIIIDEAHERPPPVDFLLEASIKILKKRPAFRLIIMSATIDADVFLDYFSRRGLTTGSIFAQGVQPHVVTHVYLRQAANTTIPADYFKQGFMHLDSILESSLSGDILWFVPTTADAIQGCKSFAERCTRFPDHRSCASVLCTELFSKATADAKSAALTPPPDPYIRKIIFATNIAESSFTFPGLSFVIDSGLELQSRWDPVRRCQVISRSMASQAQLQQREGRVGRQGPGVVHHLYSEDARQMLPAYPVARILTMDLTQEILAMLMHGGSVSAVIASCMDLLTPPTPAQVASALALLHFYDLITIPELTYEAAGWHCIDSHADLPSLDALAGKGRLTPLGIVLQGIIASARLSPWNAILLLHGAVDGQTNNALNMAVLLEELASDPAAAFLLVDDELQSAAQEVDPSLISWTSSPTVKGGDISEHATLLNILDFAVDPTTTPEVFAMRTCRMSHTFFLGVAQKAAERQGVVARLLDKWLENVTLLSDPSMQRWKDRLNAFRDVSSGRHPLFGTILASRMYHYTTWNKNGSADILFAHPCRTIMETATKHSLQKVLKVRVKDMILRPTKNTDSVNGVCEAFTDTGMGHLQATIVTHFKLGMMTIASTRTPAKAQRPSLQAP